MQGKSPQGNKDKKQATSVWIVSFCKNEEKYQFYYMLNVHGQVTETKLLHRAIYIGIKKISK